MIHDTFLQGLFFLRYATKLTSKAQNACFFASQSETKRPTRDGVELGCYQ